MRWHTTIKRGVWVKRFAIFPTKVGVSDDGKAVWVWLECFEQKFGEHHSPLVTNHFHRRPIDRPDVTPYYEYADLTGP